MQEIAKAKGENKAWWRAKAFVLHSLAGPIYGIVEGHADLIEDLLDPDNFPLAGPWCPVVGGETLHLIHPYYSSCEGEA